MDGPWNREGKIVANTTDPDDDGIDGQVGRFRRQPSARALSDQDELAFASTQRVDGDKGASRRDQAFSISYVQTIGLNDQELVTDHAFHLLRGDE